MSCPNTDTITHLRRRGARVVVVDADVRQARLAQLEAFLAQRTLVAVEGGVDVLVILHKNKRPPSVPKSVSHSHLSVDEVHWMDLERLARHEALGADLAAELARLVGLFVAQLVHPARLEAAEAFVAVGALVAQLARVRIHVELAAFQKIPPKKPILIHFGQCFSRPANK